MKEEGGGEENLLEICFASGTFQAYHLHKGAPKEVVGLEIHFFRAPCGHTDLGKSWGFPRSARPSLRRALI